MNSVDPFSPLTMGKLTIKNRFIRSAANENMSRDGLPTAAMVKLHRELAAGGVGLTTVAYIAVSELGRTLPDQLCMKPEAIPYFKKLTTAVHDAGGKISAQITHGGCFVTSLFVGKPLISSSGGFNDAGLLAGNLFKREMKQKDLELVKNQFVETAKMAVECGFDAVEVHMGHGYLLNQFISPLSNKRKDEYGGSAENRVRYPAEVLAAVKAAVGDEIAVTAKMNVADGYRGGATAEDGVVTAQKLKEAGADMLMLSGGRNVESVTFMFGSNLNVPELEKVLHDRWLPRTAIVINNKRARPITFKENYFWEYSTKIRDAVSDIPMIFLGGVKSKDNIQQALNYGFDGVAMSRVLFREPDFVNQLQVGNIEESDCDNCNGCVAYIYHSDGTRCIYLPENDPALNKVPLEL